MTQERKKDERKRNSSLNFQLLATEIKETKCVRYFEGGNLILYFQAQRNNNFSRGGKDKQENHFYHNVSSQPLHSAM